MSYRDSVEFGNFVTDNFIIECVDCESILVDIKKLKPELRSFFGLDNNKFKTNDDVDNKKYANLLIEYITRKNKTVKDLISELGINADEDKVAALNHIFSQLPHINYSLKSLIPGAAGGGKRKRTKKYKKRGYKKRTTKRYRRRR